MARTQQTPSPEATPNTEQALVKAKSNIYAVLNNEKTQKAIRAALPEMGVTAERVTSIAFSVIAGRPDLQKCTGQSLVKVIVEGSLLGLSFDPHLKQAAMVPFKNGRSGQTEAQLIVEYMGLVKLARNGGELRYVDAHIVYDKDEFDYEQGAEPALYHKPVTRGARGEAIGAYAVAKLKDGDVAFKYLTKEDIEFYREKSRAKDSSDSPWQTDPMAMWRKTAIRRLVGYLPMDDKTARAAQNDEMLETGHDQLLAPEIFGADVIDIMPEPEKSKTESVKDQLRQAKGEAKQTAETATEGAATEPAPAESHDAEHDYWWKRVIHGLDVLYKKTADADIAVSEATRGKYQSRAALEQAPIDVLKDVYTFLANASGGQK